VSQAQGESVTFRVPHAPTRYARMKVERLFPYEAAVSDSFFTVDASIAMTAFRAQRDEGGDVTVTWTTKPGPESEVSYRLERSDGAGTAFRGVHAGLLSVGEHTDYDAPPGGSYRVVAVNGLGAEYVLGGTASAGADADELLTARPLPFRGGELAITFAAAGGLGGGAAPVVVQVFDVTGRRVRDVFRGEVPAGFHRTVWDGRDEGGHDVSPGIYFLRAESGGARATVKKIAVVR
jgi:hypothetical protein